MFGEEGRNRHYHLHEMSQVYNQSSTGYSSYCVMFERPYHCSKRYIKSSDAWPQTLVTHFNESFWWFAYNDTQENVFHLYHVKWLHGNKSESETNGIWVPFKRPFHKLCINNDLWSGNFMGLTHAIKLLQLSNNLIASLAFFILLSWFQGTVYIMAFISSKCIRLWQIEKLFFKQPHSMQCPTGSITAKAWGNGFSL